MKLSNLMIASSLVASSLVAGIHTVGDFSKYPLNKDLTSISRGGTLPDKEAITDGLGTILLKSISFKNTKINNKVFNKILLKNKNEINNGHNLTNLINDNIITIDNDNLNTINSNYLVNSVVINITPESGGDNNIYTNGTSCIYNHTNVNSAGLTFSELIRACSTSKVGTYFNDVCIATQQIDGTNCSCDDGVNSGTYKNNICLKN